MPLHPFQNREKRMENALTVAGLFGAVLVVFAVMALAGGWSWTNVLSENWHLLAAVPAGLVALVVYVRGSKAQ